jgi:hypothetical protein
MECEACFACEGKSKLCIPEHLALMPIELFHKDDAKCTSTHANKIIHQLMSAFFPRKFQCVTSARLWF